MQVHLHKGRWSLGKGGTECWYARHVVTSDVSGSNAPWESLWQVHRCKAESLRIWSPYSQRESVTISVLGLVQMICLWIWTESMLSLPQPFISTHSSKALVTNLLKVKYSNEQYVGSLPIFLAKLRKLASLIHSGSYVGVICPSQGHSEMPGDFLNFIPWLDSVADICR